MENTARKIEIIVEAKPKIIHYKRVYFVKWDNVFLMLLIILFLLLMAFGHVEVEGPDPHAEETSNFYAQMESDKKWNEYQSAIRAEKEAQAEAKAEAEEESEREREHVERMKRLEQIEQEKKTSGTTYVPSM